MLVTGLLLSASIGKATAAPLCQSGSLEDYISLNATGGCTFNDLTFFRFAFAPPAMSTGGAALASASDIFVDPVNNQFGIGFSFTSSYFNLSDPNVAQSVVYGISYSTDPPPIIIGEELSLDPPMGNVAVSQQVCLNDVLANNCAFGVPLQQGVTPASPVSALQFPYAVPFVDLQTVISLQSTPGNPAKFDSLTAGTLVATPEPGSACLTALMLAVGCFARRWRR